MQFQEVADQIHIHLNCHHSEEQRSFKSANFIPEKEDPREEEEEETSKMASEAERVEYLRSLVSVREGCQRVFALAKEDKLPSFQVDLDKIPGVADYVIDVIRQSYPDDIAAVPFHSRHCDSPAMRILMGVGSLIIFFVLACDLKMATL